MTQQSNHRFHRCGACGANFIGVACAFVACIGASAQSPPQYRAKFITPGLSAISASAMNNAGSVIGTSTTGTGAWVSHGGQPATLLPVPQGFQYAAANDISETGVIVGSVSNTSQPGFGRAAVWHPNSDGGYDITVLGTLPGHVSSSATGVNTRGDIIGSSHNGTYSYPVWFTAPGGLMDLSFAGVFNPAAINDKGVLVDRSFTSKKLDLNTMQVQDLGVPTGPPNYLASTGGAINNAGQVAGLVILTTSTSCDRQAARYTDGSGWEVLSGCGTANGASDINSQGDVVMRLNLYPFVNYVGLGTYRIEDLIVEEVGHWYVINGFGITINDSRQIAVPATNSVTNEGGMILLTPTARQGDINSDGVVNVTDLLAVISGWGACPQPCPPQCAVDLNNDCTVNVSDLLLVIANWG